MYVSTGIVGVAYSPETPSAKISPAPDVKDKKEFVFRALGLTQFLA
jgi:hypothetical protein